MGNDRGQIPTIRERAGNSLRQQGILDAPFPVSPSGGKPGRAGSPHADSTLRGQQKALARIVRRLPPQEGCRPLVDPLRAWYAGLGNLRDTPRVSGHITRSPSADICRGVYTKYLTLPPARAAHTAIIKVCV